MHGQVCLITTLIQMSPASSSFKCLHQMSDQMSPPNVPPYAPPNVSTECPTECPTKCLLKMSPANVAFRCYDHLQVRTADARAAEESETRRTRRSASSDEGARQGGQCGRRCKQHLQQCTFLDHTMRKLSRTLCLTRYNFQQRAFGAFGRAACEP